MWPLKRYRFAKAANSFDENGEGALSVITVWGTPCSLTTLGSSVCGGAAYFYVLSSLPSGVTWWTETRRNQFLTSPKVLEELHGSKVFRVVGSSRTSGTLHSSALSVVYLRLFLGRILLLELSTASSKNQSDLLRWFG